MAAGTNLKGRRWRTSLSRAALTAAMVLFCLYSYSQSQRQQAELAREIKAGCAKAVPPVAVVCERAQTPAPKPAP